MSLSVVHRERAAQPGSSLRGGGILTGPGGAAYSPFSGGNPALPAASGPAKRALSGSAGSYEEEHLSGSPSGSPGPTRPSSRAGAVSGRADGSVPDDDPLPADGRSGSPPQAAEQGLLPDQRRRPRGGARRGGRRAPARLGLVLPLLPRPRPLSGPRD